MTHPDTNTRLDYAQDAAAIAYAVFRRIDFDSIDDDRDLQDEFVSAIRTAAQTDSVASFAQNLADKRGIRSFADPDGDVHDIIHYYDDAERGGDGHAFLRTVTDRPAHVELEMRVNYVDGDGDGDDATNGNASDDTATDATEHDTQTDTATATDDA